MYLITSNNNVDHVAGQNMLVKNSLNFDDIWYFKTLLIHLTTIWWDIHTYTNVFGVLY